MSEIPREALEAAELAVIDLWTDENEYGGAGNIALAALTAALPVLDRLSPNGTSGEYQEGDRLFTVTAIRGDRDRRVLFDLDIREGLRGRAPEMLRKLADQIEKAAGE